MHDCIMIAPCLLRCPPLSFRTLSAARFFGNDFFLAYYVVPHSHMSTQLQFSIQWLLLLLYITMTGALAWSMLAEYVRGACVYNFATSYC